jgi:hypothetical protein
MPCSRPRRYRREREPENKRRVLKLRECESALRRAVGILPRLDSAPYGSPSSLCGLAWLDTKRFGNRFGLNLRHTRTL